MAPSFRLLALVLFFVSAHAESWELASCAPLPEPFLVNKFLLTNGSAWTNSALGNKPQPLQVTKCRSFRNDSSYDFYQVEAGSDLLCERPPPLVNFVRYGYLDRGDFFIWMWGFLQILSLLGLTAGGLVAVAFLWMVPTLVLGAFAGALFCILPLEKGSLRGGKSSEPLPPAEDKQLLDQTSEGMRSKLKCFEATPSIKDDVCVHDSSTSKRRNCLWNRALERLLSVLWGALGAILAALTLLTTLIAIICLIAAPVLSFGAVACWNTKVTEYAGPVPLPDPSLGLNQWITSMPGGTNLTLCETPRINFYVDCPAASCEQLGEPYEDRPPVELKRGQIRFGNSFRAVRIAMGLWTR